VRATREASEDALVAAALPRVDAFLAEGVTTIEVKSGYGLETGAELRQLRPHAVSGANARSPLPPRTSARTRFRRAATGPPICAPS
jgi:imidazolonepropionase